MYRTRNRPLPRGELSPGRCVVFALLTGTLGLIILFVFVNALTAWLTLASLIGYAVVYTLWLKRATPQNIVIGGIAGATPPLLGWTAVTGQVDPYPLYTILLSVVTVLPWLIGEHGLPYLCGVLAIDALFLRHAWALYRRPSRELALKTFVYSITYLFILFALLLGDRVVLPMLLEWLG